MSQIAQRFHKFLASDLFFYTIIGLFVVQGLWLAISALYPQAFDEQFHFGLIQVYSHHWLPFLQGQPAGGNPYGAVARDPSFLYHYLMSFPYRLISLFTDSLAAHVVLLRFINVGFFTYGLYLFRKVLDRAGLSRSAANLALFIMAFIPVSIQLAGQVNYDNALVPLTAWVCLLAFKFIDEGRRKQLTFKTGALLLIACLVASLVKYSFLPIFLAVGLYLSYRMIRWYGGLRPALRSLVTAWQKAGNVTVKWSLVAALAVLFIMFAQRDLYNVVRFHDVAPDCAYVLDDRSCSAYDVWYHDFTTHKQVVAHQVYVSSNPVWYFYEWTYWLWYRLFFVINGVTRDYANYPPLPLPAAAFLVLGVLSVGCFMWFLPRLRSLSTNLKLLGFIAGIYLVLLLAQGVMKYRATGVLELMNGRYLLPILVPLMAVAGVIVNRVVKGSTNLKLIGSAVVIVCFLQGGGVLSFISRSDSTWYWDNQSIRSLNEGAQKVVHPLILEGPKTYNTGKWFFN